MSLADRMSSISTPTAEPSRGVSRRRLLGAGCGLLGLSLSDFLCLRGMASPVSTGAGFSRAKQCILLYCWGGMSHIDTLDPKPDAPDNVRGEFKPIETATPGIRFSEHLPGLAKQTGHLAIVRSIHHGSSAHGKGMYWNMTGHPPPAAEAAVNQPPSRSDWPSLAGARA